MVRDVATSGPPAPSAASGGGCPLRVRTGGAEGPMLRGNCPAKIDAKGRIKIPNSFRRYIEDKYGRELFVTSLAGEFVRVYPMPEWLEVEKKIAAAPSIDPAITRFTNMVNYYGQAAAMDDQGRLLIHPILRHASGLDGLVAVLGHQPR